MRIQQESVFTMFSGLLSSLVHAVAASAGGGIHVSSLHLLPLLSSPPLSPPLYIQDELINSRCATQELVPRVHWHLEIRGWRDSRYSRVSIILKTKTYKQISIKII